MIQASLPQVRVNLWDAYPNAQEGMLPDLNLALECVIGKLSKIRRKKKHFRPREFSDVFEGYARDSVSSFTADARDEK